MIEREIVKDKFQEYKVTEFIKESLGDVPVEKISLEKTPVGERIIIFSSAPGLIIGREGSNIKKLTILLKEKFNFESPQIKIGEIKDINLSASIVAKRIANDLANFGPKKFKLTGFRNLQNVMNAGAKGVEIKISGKLPSTRSKQWRFAKGYLKKTGYVSDFLVDKAIESVTLKTGVVGIQVSIMFEETALPDKIDYLENITVEDKIDNEEDLKSKENLELLEEDNKSKEKSISKTTTKKTTVKKKTKEEVKEE